MFVGCNDRPNGIDQPPPAHGLRYEAIRASRCGAFSILAHDLGGHDDYRYPPGASWQGSDRPYEVEPVRVRQDNVHQHDIVIAPTECV